MKTNMKNFITKTIEKLSSIIRKICIYIGCFMLLPVLSFLLFNINNVLLLTFIILKFLIFIMALTSHVEVFINMEPEYIGFDLFEGISQFSKNNTDHYEELYQNHVQGDLSSSSDESSDDNEEEEVEDECPCDGHDLTSPSPDHCGCRHENTRPVENGEDRICCDSFCRTFPDTEPAQLVCTNCGCAFCIELCRGELAIPQPYNNQNNNES